MNVKIQLGEFNGMLLMHIGNGFANLDKATISAFGRTGVDGTGTQ